ncbi:hypothetical protein BU204_10810 [Actinophytocola xanthii]|uniref:Uncharacterized protein n=1 Tax=Actinophytocola xanthii TaxID=1912961 RepID=A0A1Q8CSU4_9PSEU|nr:hypothetical protein BU204_10810 [Actinophytocola xanthii]
MLVGVHTITSLMRLEDHVMLVEGDPRLQILYTQVPDRLGDGVGKCLAELEVRTLPWQEAVQGSFDLTVSASLHRMGEVPAKKRFSAPHGAGFTKLWPAWAWPGDADARPVYGLDRESLLDAVGGPIFDALVVPHPDHITTLARQCPESVPYALVTGDPCLDRLLASASRREHYRTGLGVRPAQVLVAVASTWGRHSLIATQRDVLLRLTAELPANHRVIATLHPAVWAEHGTRQVRNWMREVRAVGVDLIDVGEDWRGLVAAADLLVADHGSLAAYAAATRVPVLFSPFGGTDVDSSSVVAELAAVSPRLVADVPLLTQLQAAVHAQPAQWRVARRRVAAMRGQSAEVLRQCLYRLLELPEPEEATAWPQVPVPRLVDGD